MPVSQLMEVLETIRRRAKLLSLVFGLGVVIAAAVAALGVTVLLDYLLNLPALPRLVVMLAAFGAVCFLGWRHVARPLLSRVSLGDVAGRVESLYPQFEDRLRSAVQFEDQPEANLGSPRMRKRVTQQAAEIAGRVDLKRVLRARPAFLSVGGGAAAVVLLLLTALLLGSTYRGIIASRLASPFDAQPWPTKQVIAPGEVPQTVPAGRRVEISMSLEKGDDPDLKPILFYRTAAGVERQVFMKRTADGRFTATLDARLDETADRGQITARIEAGDDEETLPPINVVPRLKIEQVTADIAPPPYVSGRQPITTDLARSTAVTADGATITLNIDFNKPLAEGAEVRLIPTNDAAPEVDWQPTTGTTAIGRWVARETTRFRIAAVDADGFDNAALSEYEIIVRPDQPPTVILETPRRNERRTAAATVPVVAVVEDDFGFDAVEIVVQQRIGDDVQEWQLPLFAEDSAAADVAWSALEAGGDRQRFRAAYDWKLDALDGANLEPGAVLEFFVRAVDNYDLDGSTHPPATSGTLRITIIGQDELANEVLDDLRLIKDRTEQVRNRQKRTQQETQNLREETEENEEFTDADEAANRRLVRDQSGMAGATKKLAAQAEELQQRLEENAAEDEELKELTEKVAETLDAAAEGPMKQATSKLDQAGAAEDQQQPRNEALEAAEEEQREASKMLDQAVEDMQNVGSLKGAINDVRDLLEKQRQVSEQTRDAAKDAVGQNPANLNEEQKQALDDAAEEQNQLADETDKLADELDELAEQMKQSDPESAKAMEEAARTMRRQQTSQQQREAAEQTQQNKQADAQQSQNQVEIGLEMVLSGLREAEARQLRQLARKLAELQEQIANLTRRQSGHNLDNLTLRGEAALEEAGAEEVSRLLQLAQRIDAEGNPEAPDPALDVDRLAAGQAQTERNTRSIAADAEQLPEGAEPAADLTRAAGLMERANVDLRGDDLPGAFGSQEKALAALLAAKETVDEQKQNADDQLEEQRREAIRQRYVKVRDEQQALNEAVATLDAKRGADGQLDRAARRDLNKTPGEQGTLQDEIDAIGEDLATLGSTVYLWANKDIRDTMGDVKSRLGDGDSGAVTRSEQTRIVVQLDAMIENLKMKEPDERFTQQGGGGGGGGEGQPRLPSSAELRLLRDLQKAVNSSTENVAAQPEEAREDETLIALGNRQGDLRSVLDELMQKSSNGQLKLGPEPDNRDQLPEEAGEEAVEEQVGELLGGDPEQGGDVGDEQRIGDRMARSRQRLALNQDPGQTTQIIQDRIIEDFADLIDQAEQQEQVTRSQQQQQQQQGGQQQAPQPGQGQQPGQQQGGQQGSQQSTAPGEGPAPDSDDLGPEATDPANIDGDIAGQDQSWGGLTPRQRQAVIEGQQEQTLGEYGKLVADYFKGLNDKANQQ